MLRAAPVRFTSNPGPTVFVDEFDAERLPVYGWRMRQAKNGSLVYTVDRSTRR